MWVLYTARWRPCHTSTPPGGGPVTPPHMHISGRRREANPPWPAGSVVRFRFPSFDLVLWNTDSSYTLFLYYNYIYTLLLLYTIVCLVIFFFYHHFWMFISIVLVIFCPSLYWYEWLFHSLVTCGERCRTEGPKRAPLLEWNQWSVWTSIDIEGLKKNTAVFMGDFRSLMWLCLHIFFPSCHLKICLSFQKARGEK